MKVGIIGGTGTMGRALAKRFAAKHEVLLGSRDKAKAGRVVEEVRKAVAGKIRGGSNAEVSAMCDVAILAVPNLNAPGFLEGIKQPLSGKIVISAIVPMRVEGGILVHGRASGSAAEEVASILVQSRVVAAFHHIPALTLLKRGRIDCDVLVACDDRSDYEAASVLIRSIEGLRPLYVGPLSVAGTLESITPLLINSGKLNGLKRLSLKLVD